MPPTCGLGNFQRYLWCASYVAAFEFFGGVPARMICDNLKTGVDRPDLYDPKINRAYAELALFYGLLIDPARAGKPKDKPRIERPMPYIRDSFFKGRDFTSLAQMQDAALTWCTDVYARQQHRRLDGTEPAAIFDAIEKCRLALLPPRPIEPVLYQAAVAVAVAVDIAQHLLPGRCGPPRVVSASPARTDSQRIVSEVVGGHLISGVASPPATSMSEMSGTTSIETPELVSSVAWAWSYGGSRCRQPDPSDRSRGPATARRRIARRGSGELVRGPAADLELDYSQAKFGSAATIYLVEFGREILSEPPLLFSHSTA